MQTSIQYTTEQTIGEVSVDIHGRPLPRPVGVFKTEPLITLRVREFTLEQHARLLNFINQEQWNNG